MVAKLFEMGTPAWEIVARTGAVYVAILIGFRVLGKREIGQMNLVDLVLILLIANAVQNAMVGSDTSLQGGLLAAAVLVVIDRVLGFVRVRDRGLRRLLQGEPVLLVSDGQLLQANLRRQGLSEDDMMMALREHGIGGLREVGAAWLEADGSISIIPSKQPPLRSRRRARSIRKPE